MVKIKVSEHLLQFIRKLQYLNLRDLETIGGEKITVIDKGTHNTNQGPDFLNAKIKIDDTLLAGNIELHVNSSDWHKHKHESDPEYQNIILHIVWQHDLFTQALHQYPILVLEPYVAKTMLKHYEQLQQQPKFIPCESMFHKVTELNLIIWQERLMIERLEQKTQYILNLLNDNDGNWEETFWQMMAKIFGGTVNGEAFELMAKHTSNTLLAKNKLSFLKIEALLMGQSGLLNEPIQDAYGKMLTKEYQFLKKKYGLQPALISSKFLRMRPVAFPTIRLSQLADLIFNSTHLFSKIIECSSYKDCMQFLQLSANDYWATHYKFDDAEHTFTPKHLGKDMQHLIIVNTIVPTLFAYGIYKDDTVYKKRALSWLEQIPAEVNNITKGFKALDVKIKTAVDAQSLIQLKNHYCNKLKCLDCAVGSSILKG